MNTRDRPSQKTLHLIFEAHGSGFSENELCEIYQTLNKWEWPTLLGATPEWWDKLPTIRSKWWGAWKPTKYKMIRPVFQEIERVVGKKKLLNWWWLHEIGRTQKEFDDWYETQVSNFIFS